MTTTQRIIKSCATALAICLAIAIIGGIVSAVVSTSFVADWLLSGKETTEHSGREQVQMLEVPLTVTKLDVDLSATDLKIVVGDMFSVSSDSDRVKMAVNGNELTIEETGVFVGIYHETAILTLTIPENVVFEEADFDIGACKLEAECLTAEKLSLSLGAGSVTFDALEVTRAADVETGVGKLVVADGTLRNLDMEMGVGKADVRACLLGDSQIETGVGGLQLTLLGGKDRYGVVADTGLGAFRVDGQTVDDERVIGSGVNRVTIRGGVGQVDVEFAS